jgi:predicted DNA-binding protein YlxM (UPF0122 family)
MDKFEEMALLLDIYGDLLTDKQRDVMDQYYNYDLSLQEIADNEGISKQGVHDLIRRSEHTLVKTDEKLGFRDRLADIQAGLERVSENLNDITKGIDEISKSQADKDLYKASKNPALDSADLDSTGTNMTDLNLSYLQAALESCRSEIERLKNTCMGG